MYKDYLWEREQAEIVEFDSGFMVLKVLPEMLYIQDIYVKPAHRQKGVGKMMLMHAENMAREIGKTMILGTCCPIATGATTSMKSMLASGFELKSCDANLIYLVKKIEPIQENLNG